MPYRVTQISKFHIFTTIISITSASVTLTFVLVQTIDKGESEFTGAPTKLIGRYEIRLMDFVAKFSAVQNIAHIEGECSFSFRMSLLRDICII